MQSVITDDLKWQAGFCTLPRSFTGCSQPLPSVALAMGNSAYCAGSATLKLQVKALSFGTQQVTPGI